MQLAYLFLSHCPAPGTCRPPSKRIGDGAQRLLDPATAILDAMAGDAVSVKAWNARLVAYINTLENEATRRGIYVLAGAVIR